jgi:hypothetical protein
MDWPARRPGVTSHALIWPALLCAVGACSSALDNQPRPGTDAAATEKPVDTQAKPPTDELIAKHEAAKAAPADFEPVFAYAKGLTDFYLAQLADTSCAPDCDKGTVKYTRKAEADPGSWFLFEDAKNRVDAVMKVQGLADAQMEQLVAIRGRLLWLVGRPEDEVNSLGEYANAHPSAVVVVKRRLELLREAGDSKESEAQCARSRVALKSGPEAAQLELLTSCVANHPDNAEGKSYVLDYVKFLPLASKAEQRLYRKYLVRTCIETVGPRETRCAEFCACGGKGLDRAKKAACKKMCVYCRVETAQKVRECKKAGTTTFAPFTPPRPRRGGGGGGAKPEAEPDGPQPQTTVL